MTVSDQAFRVFDGFFELLKRNQIAITPRDKQEALRGLRLVGLANRNEVRATLGALLSHSPEESTTVEQLFQLYFAGSLQTGELISGDGAEASESIRAELADNKDLHRLAQRDPLLRELTQGDEAALRMRLSEIAREIELGRIQNFLQTGYFTFQALDRLGMYRLQGQIRNAGGTGGALDRQLDRLRQTVTDMVQEALQQQDLQVRERFRRNSLLDQPLLSVSAEQRENMRFELERLIQILRTRLSRRRKKMRRGQIDIHRTIRNNLGNDGIPFNLSFRDKPKRKPEIVVLADVSESVRNATEFLLLFVYSLQEAFRRVRSFLFAGHLTESTDLFREASFDNAVGQIFSGEILNIWEPSNFGRSFDEFSVRYADALTPKTSLIILGDARNNYNPDRAELVRQFREKAYKTYWLNPEPRGAWGFGDSAMPAYEPFVDEAVEVRTLRQLNRFINRLVLR